ncbi:efflux RND transporter periplasmic adaptor subunit (plasmid) [Tundrisphaera lichenicola]|uniref:efflux RND transporter periplasmic adaptor subunit n=1 Tax=Tundrisphaera lichenicola TaxID=2029860 RepID=UPI003EBD1FDE
MRLSWRPLTLRRLARYIAPALGLAALAVPGCGHKDDSHYESVANPPKVRVVRPSLRTIIRTVGQPSFIQSYERTSIYPKMTAYIENWIVDIGDKVKKGQTLATLFVPEMVEDFGTKKATVKLDEERIELAKQLVEVAEADVEAARATLAESKAILGKYEAEAERWDTEVKRLDREVKRGVIDPQILLESTNQWKSALASKDAAKSSIDRSAADLLASESKLGKAKIDVAVARAELGVATSEAKRLEAWVGYLTLHAPFDGIIVVRNANSSDFVLPNTGDPTAMNRSPDLSPGGAAPIYVVDRTDIVRIFVDIPESDANYVKIGAKASVLAKAYRDEPIPGSVTRTSWALNVKSRTLRAEIDLPNPDGQLLPGMYSYTNVIIERPDVRALPVSALAFAGDKSFCWMLMEGHAKKAEIRTGVSDGEWIEVIDIRRPSTLKGGGAWSPVDGSEHVILGDLSILAEDEPIEVSKGDEKKGVAGKDATAETPPGGAHPGS